MIPTESELNDLLNLYRAGDFGVADIQARRFIDVYPGHFLGWEVLGALLLQKDKFEEALICFKRSLSLRPNNPDTLNNIAATLERSGQLSDAVQYYKKSLSLRPNNFQARFNFANALKSLGLLEEAIDNYSCAVNLNPVFPECFNNLGVASEALGQLRDAETAYKKAISLKQDYFEARSNLLFMMNYAEWIDSQEYLSEAIEFGRKLSSLASPKFDSWKVMAGNDKVRVGFVSGDMRHHPVGRFLESLLGQISKERFEFFAFPTFQTEDEVAKKLRNLFQGWFPLWGKSDYEAAQLIHSSGVHILFDLSGHSRHNRLPVFSHKPAPVQVCWLGYFATTGLPEMDYLIGDPIVSPCGDSGLFTEKLISLPKTWLSIRRPDYDCADKINFVRPESLIFGFFGNIRKVNSRVIQVWAEILKNLPDAKLIIKSNDLSNQQVFRAFLRHCSEAGLPEEQLIMEGHSTLEDYYRAFERIAILLDPFPYCGGTISLDSIVMGVPFITLKGSKFVSRIGESILRNVGFDNWIAEDESDYITKAIEFGSKFDFLVSERERLRVAIKSSPLFDIQSFAVDFESLLVELSRSPFIRKPSTSDRSSFREQQKLSSTRVKKSPQKLLNKIYSAYHTKNLRLTEELANKMVISYPNLTLGWNILGSLHREMGNLNDAVSAFKKSLGIESRNPEALNGIGMVFEALGRLDEAESAYRTAIDFKNNFPEALKNLADLLRSEKRIAEAIEVYYRALKLRPTFAEVHNDLGLLRKELGQFDLAEASYREAIRHSPNFFEAHTNLGNLLRLLGKVSEAETLLREAIKLRPQSEVGYLNLGALLVDLKRYFDAETVSRMALSFKPDSAQALNNLGSSLVGLQRTEEARGAFLNAISIKPNFSEALNNLAHLMQKEGDLNGAIEHLKKALSLRPDYIDALNNLGVALKDLGETSEAERVLLKAISLKPNVASIRNNLANLLLVLGRFDEAEAQARTAIEIDPLLAQGHDTLGAVLASKGFFRDAALSHSHALELAPREATFHINLGNCHRELAAFKSAADCYRKAIECDSKVIESHLNLSIILLSEGSYIEGFAAYEARWGTKYLRAERRDFLGPEWRGEEPIRDKRVLIYAEQGLGDTIQFCRYIRLVKSLGAYVIFELQSPLYDLFKRLVGVDELVRRGEQLPEYDFCCPLLSLPFALKTDKGSIPPAESSISPQSLSVERWRNKLGGAGFKIGICWRASKIDRSVPIDFFSRLLVSCGVRLISLHRKDINDELINSSLAGRIELPGPDIDVQAAFVDTSSVIANCDLVISVDTALAHLAGSIGVPTWVVLKFVPDWRWMIDRSDSPWYPSVKLFRQQKIGDWETPFNQMRQIIEERVL